MTSESGASWVPAVQPAQFFGGSGDRPEGTVNLFTGDVLFEQPLVHFPGADSNALEVRLAARYQSNVSLLVARDNLTAPTGVLGVGWNLFLDSIVADSSSPAAGARTFFYQSGGQQIQLVASRAGAAAPEGAMLYELEAYDFSRIAYFPADERWEITKSDGTLYRFGGSIEFVRPGNYRTSAGNSVEWGVKWGGATGAWVGASAETKGQSQYAVGWHLQSVIDRWGNAVSYEYNGFARVNGLLPDVERLVGPAGATPQTSTALPYTKSCYLTRVLDVRGRSASFTYAPKEFGPTAMEYVDPHSDDPRAVTASAYQDRYETQYLASIAIQDASGNLIETLQFGYSDPVSLVDTTDPTITARSAKRYLSSITAFNAQRQALPATEFAYYLQQSEGGSLGALAAVTQPAGSTARYTYTNEELPVCDRQVTISAPGTKNGDTAIPRIWFGPDYAALLWIDSGTNDVWLTIYSWVGRWVAWQPPGAVYTGGEAVELSSFQTVCGGDYCAIIFEIPSGSRMLLIHRDQRQLGQWIIAASTAGDSLIAFSSTSVTLVGGVEFVAVVEEDVGAQTSWALSRYTWSWNAQRWIGEPQFARSSDALFIAATGNVLVSLSYPSRGGGGVATLYALDELSVWTESPTLDVMLPGPLSLALTPPQLAAGDTMVAMTVITNLASSQLQYAVVVVQWDGEHRFLSSSPQQWTETQSGANVGRLGSLVMPIVTADSLLFTGYRLFRYTGSQWLRNDALVIQQAEAAPLYWAAVGDDLAVQVTNSGQPSSAILAFDANADSEQWTRAAEAPQPQPSVVASQQTQYFPTAEAGDYFTIGNDIYYRGSSVDWSVPAQAPVYPIPAEIDSTSVVNEAPGFILYSVPNPAQVELGATVVLMLINGTQVTPVTLSGQSYVSPAVATSGTFPAGPDSFVTFPAGTIHFDDAATLTLYRFTGDAVSGPIPANPVVSVVTDNGFGEVTASSYEFDFETAACDASGMFVRFYRSTVYPAAATPIESAFGRAVHVYVNGVGNSGGLPGFFTIDGYPLARAEFSGGALFAVPLAAVTLSTGSGPQPAPTSLSALFAAHGLTLPATALVTYVAIGGYWLVTDDHGAPLYNIDSNGDASDTDAVKVFSGGPVVTETTTWTMFTSRNTDPVVPADTPIYGSYALPTEVLPTMDGVPGAMVANTYTRSGWSGAFSEQPLVTSRSFINGTDAHEVDTQVFTYGAEAYAELLAANDVSTVVQTMNSTAVGGQQPVVHAVSAVTWKSWTKSDTNTVVFDQEATYEWNGAPAAPDFPFGTPSPVGWDVRQTVTQRAPTGAATETVDGDSICTSVILAVNNLDRLATIGGASVSGDEASYLTVDPNSRPLSWTWRGAQISSDASFIGSRSLLLSDPGTDQVTTTLTPVNQTARYYFACQFLTAPGTIPAASSGWTISFADAAGAIGTPIAAPFTATNGEWQYLGVEVDLPSIATQASGPVSISFVAALGGAGAVYLDCVRFLPLASILKARALDAAGDESGSLSGGTRVTRTFLDAFRRPGVQAIASGLPSQIRTTFLSRTAAASFAPAEPNSTFDVRPISGGHVETFLDAGGWTNRWTAGVPSAWQSTHGILQYDGAASDTLTSIAQVTEGVAVYLQFAPAANSLMANGQGISIGQTLMLRSVSTGWTLTVNGSAIVPLVTGTAPGSEWLLLVQGTTVAFVVDGRLIFSTIVPTTPSGPVGIVAGDGPVALRALALAFRPAVTVQFLDGDRVSRQSQALAANDAIIRQRVRDLTGRTTIETKAAPASFGSGKGQPLLTYRRSFVDVAAFRCVLEGPGIMTGDVATYYAGEDGRSDDGGYPFFRERREPAPSARVIERGSPGTARAINLDVPLASRPTTRIRYTPNGGDPITRKLSLPIGTFGLVTHTDPDGHVEYELGDALKQVFARAAAVNGTDDQYWIRSWSRSGDGTVITMRQPNAQGSSTSAEFVVTAVFDTHGRLLQRVSPADEGMVRFLYSPAGRQRFMQDERNAGDDVVVVTAYDGAGRTVGRALLSASWDALASHAEDLQWPPQSDTQALTTIAYDGNGTTGSSIGEIVETRAFTYVSGERVAVVDANETYTHDDAGLITSITRTMSGSLLNGSVVDSMAYSYDGAAQEIAVTVSSGVDTVAGISTTYDDVMRIASLSDRTGVAYGSYTYTAEGLFDTLSFRNGVVRSYAYSPVGSPIAITDAARGKVVFAESNAYAPSGLMTAAARTYPESANSFSDSYGYDAALRLQANASSASARQFTSATYDANNNLLSLTANGQTLYDAILASGTNELQSITTSSQATQYEYLINGQLKATTGAAALNFDYGPGGTQLPVRVTRGAATVTFAYDARGRRVAKNVAVPGAASTTLFYVYGTAPQAVATILSSGRAVTYVHGPAGLLAADDGGSPFFVSADHEQSTCVVTDANGNVAASYVYDVFGALTFTAPGGAVDFPYLYTGQEWDSELLLYNYRARLYDPVARRFIAIDPVRRLTSPYAYVNNDPVSFIDPSGRISRIFEFGLAFAEFAIAAVFAALAPPDAPALAGVLTLLQNTAVGAGTSAIISGIQNQKSGDFATGQLIGALTGLLLGFASSSRYTRLAVRLRATRVAPGPAIDIEPQMRRLLTVAQISSGISTIAVTTAVRTLLPLLWRQPYDTSTFVLPSSPRAIAPPQSETHTLAIIRQTTHGPDNHADGHAIARRAASGVFTEAR